MAMIVYQLQSPLIQSNAGRLLSGCVVLLAVYAKKTELFACACFGRPLITAKKGILSFSDVKLGCEVRILVWHRLCHLSSSPSLPVIVLSEGDGDMNGRLRGADFDLTGQLVWPGALLLNDYLAKNAEMLQGCSIIELGSGVGVTGILCSRFCPQLLLTDHNDEILKKNIELCASSENPNCCAELAAEKLEWGNSDHIDQILQRYSRGFDLILGADIYILSSVPLLFDTVERLLHVRGGQCKFILAYVSRAKSMDSLIMKQAAEHGMRMVEVTGTRSVVGNLEGVIFEVALQ
ncbi:hypothetical protein POTOM_032942 [Populus tomentosa]|uniref:S-adenosyl-L-methionine-dependent methyltransferases superfamily protein n=1 Tax=Populus tomentosa TaxID=118781 RepID=A0A8X8CQH1_POPTO|nr:hypothetical protein POTOM_032942 [Populus tomentosa]